MGTEEFRLRRVLAAEAERLAALAQRLFRQAYAATHPDPDLADYLTAELAPAVVAAELACDGVAVWLAESAAGEALGYLWLAESAVPPEVAAVSARPLHLRRIFVDASRHGAGLATALLAAARAEAVERGADALWLAVWQEAARPIAFYRRQGFGVVGTTRFAFGERIDEDFLMVCPLGYLGEGS